MEIFLTIRADRTMLALADRLIDIGRHIIQKENQIMATLQEVVNNMATQTTDIDSIGALIKGLRDQIAALPAMTPEMQGQVDGLFASIEKNKATLAAAMAMNVQPIPPPEAVPAVVV